MNDKFLPRIEEKAGREGAGSANRPQRSRQRGLTVPVLQVSFISRHRSLTEDALLPSAAPIVAQSLPCFIRSLKQESANQHLVQLFSPF